MVPSSEWPHQLRSYCYLKCLRWLESQEVQTHCKPTKTNLHFIHGKTQWFGKTKLHAHDTTLCKSQECYTAVTAGNIYFQDIGKDWSTEDLNNCTKLTHGLHWVSSHDFWTELYHLFTIFLFPCPLCELNSQQQKEAQKFDATCPRWSSQAPVPCRSTHNFQCTLHILELIFMYWLLIKSKVFVNCDSSYWRNQVSELLFLFKHNQTIQNLMKYDDFHILKQIKILKLCPYMSFLSTSQYLSCFILGDTWTVCFSRALHRTGYFEFLPLVTIYKYLVWENTGKC